MTTDRDSRWIAAQSAGANARWAFDIAGEVYITPAAPEMDTCGMPMGARWESSRSHWDRYFETVHAPAGWRMVPPVR